MSTQDQLQLKRKWQEGPGIRIQFYTNLEKVQRIHLSSPFSRGIEIEIFSPQLSKNLNTQIELWVDQYSQGLKSTVSIPLEVESLPLFTQKVLSVMQDIPFGEIYTYGEVARRAGAPKAARAVGGACRRNPFILVVPCHRVIDSGRNLRGYSAGGLEMKKLLLDFEDIVL